MMKPDSSILKLKHFKQKRFTTMTCASKLLKKEVFTHGTMGAWGKSAYNINTQEKIIIMIVSSISYLQKMKFLRLY